MSLLGALFSALVSWWPWSDPRAEQYNSITTSGNATETIAGTGEDERINIAGAVRARDTGTNVIDMGDGQDTLNIFGRVESDGNGCNDISLGEGSSRLSITGPVQAFDKGNNNISAGSGKDVVTITGGLKACGSATNDINLGDGENILSISLGLASYDSATNIITTGDDNDMISISLGLYSEFENSINAGEGDNCITTWGGLNANGGTNSILCGDGNDTVSIWGVTKAAAGGENHVETGGGNDVISLHNNIGAGALLIDAGIGDDMLVLNGSRASLFNTAYEGWLTDYASTNGLQSMNIETIEVTLTRTAGISDLQWLSDLAADAKIDLQLNIDGNGRSLNLGNFFETGDDVFSVLSMEGGVRNTLSINGSLSDNHYDGKELFILGDNNDTVKISSEWEQMYTTQEVGNPYQNYYVFGDSDGDKLLIHHNISVITM